MKVQNQLLPARGGLLLCGRGGAVQRAGPVGGAPSGVSLRSNAQHAVAWECADLDGHLRRQLQWLVHCTSKTS